ncbi:hypothetical protein ACWGDE_09335 [Streptomyces sp. NPDC054956]
MTWQRLGWLCGTVWVLAAASLITYFATVGLDRADKLASAIGLPVALLGLAGQVLALVMAQRGPAPDPPGPGYVRGSRISVSRVRGPSRVVLRRPDPVLRPEPASPQSGGTHIEGNHVQVHDVGESVIEER